ncbi:MAG: aminopeptidase P family protein [Stappiaceae bacterium]
MFQDFTLNADPSTGPARLADLRTELASAGFEGFIIPRSDAHQGENVPERDERLAWLTGFTGSAGLAIVLSERAAVFVDGRYTLQVLDQVDGTAFERLQSLKTAPDVWLGDNAGKGLRIAYDPMLHTVADVRKFQKACEKAGSTLVPVEENLVDRVWHDQPEPPLAAVSLHPVAYSGEKSTDKIPRIQKEIAKQGAEAAILTLPDSIAWLFNIRGGDVPNTPLPLSFALVPAKGPCTIFIDGRKLSNEVRDELAEIIEIRGPEAFLPTVGQLAETGSPILLDPHSAPEAVARCILAKDGKIIEKRDPVKLPKAIKNAVEQDGARTAHLRDGVAFARFLAWFDANAGEGTLDEISVARELEKFRAETGRLKDLSFDTISGAGANGAIVHYRVTENTNRKIEPGSLYLVDSGAQYEDGTTDITRTLAVGPVTEEMKRHFTLVLKGHIAISTARFPEGATGAQLDTLARVAMWKAGVDFDHGTGHGVGSYLSVHEGPQNVSKRGSEPLQPGMILSNEPGFYKTGSYGIRIENLELVRNASDIEGGDRPMLSFETLTFAPIDRHLVNSALLDEDELQWLNGYHAEVLAKISHGLEEDTRKWLAEACAPIE